jgi:dTDP-4-dehydrorhamnose 3,5-epimerase
MENTQHISLQTMKPQLYRTGVFTDDRGIFFPLQLEKRWLQSNISISQRWTFRGLHHQLGETAQSKFISVIRGSIVDFLVDLRKNSFEEAYFFKLVPGDQIYIPKGFAHGFLALEDDTIIQYLVDNVYSPRTEISFDWKSNSTVREIVLAEVGEVKNLKISPKDAIGKPITRDFAETIDYSTI